MPDRASTVAEPEPARRPFPAPATHPPLVPPGHEPIDGATEARPVVLRFLAVSTLCLVAVCVLAVLWTHRLAEDDALRTDVESNAALATRAVAPLVSAELAAGDASAQRRLDQLVRSRIADGSIQRGTLWDVDGRIIYSDDPGLVGRRFLLNAARRATLRSGTSHADLSDFDAADTAGERGHSRSHVEVYAGLTGADGRRYLFEAHVSLTRLQHTERWLLVRLVPAAVATLGLLMALQLPLALSLARRIERAHDRHRGLLSHALTASARERLRLAQDLHDEVIQDLAGLGYALSGTVKHLPEDLDPRLGSTMITTDAVLRRCLVRLRQIVLDVHPPRLEDVDLSQAVQELCEPLRARGVRTTLSLDPDARLDILSKNLLYRVVRESLRNVARHSGASSVEVCLASRPGEVALEVTDDGVGFAWVPGQRSRAGHDGLLLLHDALAAAGGTFDVSSEPGRGCRITAKVPG